MDRTPAGRLSGILAPFAVAILFATPTAANPIVVNPGVSAAAMVANLVNAASGITVVPGSETYVGAPLASGLFTGGTGILPFDAGVALTTGRESNIPGPNNRSNTTFSNGTAADPNLDAVARAVLNLGPAVNLHSGDAALLSFQFTSTLPAVSFQYVFGSEEYNEFVNTQFNDVFAFFLNGVNIAVLPNTDPPVVITVNSVHTGKNDAYFFNNISGARNIQYDGLVGVTIPLFATGNVNPGVNTIVLGIEDVGDLTFDSGVMLAANSFTATTPPEVVPTVPEPGTWLFVGSGLAVAVRRKWLALPCRARNSSCTPRPGASA